MVFCTVEFDALFALTEQIKRRRMQHSQFQFFFFLRIKKIKSRCIDLFSEHQH